MDYYSEYYDELQAGGGRGGGIPRVFVGSPYQRGHGIGSFLGGLFRRALPYLKNGLRTVGKEALRAGANIIEDIENNTPFKVAAKHRFEESRDNLKRKAKEKISKLMKGSGYKSNAKVHVAQFPFGGLNTHIVKSKTNTSRKRRRTSRKNLPKVKSRGKKKTNTKTSKNKTRKSRTTVKRLKTSAKRRKTGKKRSVYDIFS